jgi:hypothetical protein
VGRYAAGPIRVGRSWAGVALVVLLAAGGLVAGLRLFPPDPAAARPGDTVAAAATRPGTAPLTTGPPAAGPATPGTGAGSGTPTAGTGAGGTGDGLPPVTRQAPVELRIPAIGLEVGLSQLGLNPDRTVEVPTDYAQAGWFRLGPTPGQRGSAVVLGHVDSYRGPAVFFRLRALRPGDQVQVGLADGTVARFAVRAVETYLKREFPARRVYGDSGGRSLQLVTCGGDFDRTARSYLSNVVVYTELLAVDAPQSVRAPS